MKIQLLFSKTIFSSKIKFGSKIDYQKKWLWI